MRTRRRGRPLRAAMVGGLAAAVALAVGDSVMLGAVPQLRRAGFEVNARGCRQMSQGVELLASLRGSLPDVVVVALGYNWTITIEEIRRALIILGPGRVLGMVTPRGEYASARAAIHAAGPPLAGPVQVLRWAARSTGKPWTWDGLHLTPSGARGFARLLSNAFEWELPGLAPAPKGPPVEQAP